MNKCFAYNEIWKNGYRYNSCECLTHKAFTQVQHKRGGCCMKNCPFYKENREQIRSDIGIYRMSDKQKAEQEKYFKLNYKGVQNIHNFG